jgi:hypothetical protein
MIGGGALLVLIDADTEVDLGGARISRVFAHERQDLVAGGLGEGLEHVRSRSGGKAGCLYRRRGGIFAIYEKSAGRLNAACANSGPCHARTFIKFGDQLRDDL